MHGKSTGAAAGNKHLTKLQQRAAQNSSARMAAPLKQGWLEKHSVSAPIILKNWRRRHLKLWPNSISWHHTEEARPAGELQFEAGTTVQRDVLKPTLSIACAGRVLVLRGTAREVCNPTSPLLHL